MPNKKLVLIIILALVIAVMAVIEPNFKGKSHFNIEDKCGKFINVMSHTIEDEKICKTRCRAQCESAERKYAKADFKKIENGCNSCLCYCR